MKIKLPSRLALMRPVQDNASQTHSSNANLAPNHNRQVPQGACTKRTVRHALHHAAHLSQSGAVAKDVCATPGQTRVQPEAPVAGPSAGRKTRGNAADALALSRQWPDAMAAAPHASLPEAAPRPLTKARLKAWVNQAGLRPTEQIARRKVQRRIVQLQPILSRLTSDTIVIASKLDLRDCPELTQLPDGLSVGGELVLDGCTNLASLPEGLSVGGDLGLNGCFNLTELPESLNVGGNLVLDGGLGLGRLPNNMHVGGNLDLEGWTGLNKLPDNLSVGGNLDLRSCTSLTELPASLRVGGHLDISRCTSLTKLPEGLSLNGYLDLSGCAALTQLPDHLRVAGRLDLKACTALTQLPETLSVGDSLELRYCISLMSLPDNLCVGGTLDLRDCPSLTSLPAGLRVWGNLDLTDRMGLAQLPEGLWVGGDLDLKDLRSLTELPEGFTVGGSLDLWGCTGLTQLPENLSVGGSLYLSRCTNITELPAGLSIGANFDLWNCTGLTKLPHGFSTRGHLNLSRCVGLTTLPDDLRVMGNLDLRDCTGLTQLPEGLTVGGSLNLFRCTGILQLPEGLSVGGNLNLFDCTGLTQLPTHCRIGGHLTLACCTSLTSLPTSITRWGRCSNGEVRIVDLTGSGLSTAILARLQTAQTPDMRFAFGVTPTSRPDVQFAQLADAVRFWTAEQIPASPIDANQWHLAADERLLLVDFLGRLCGTADYTNHLVRPRLVARVSQLLVALEHDAILRAQALDCISDALHSCDDRVILIMNQLELAMRVRQAEQGDLSGEALKRLVLGLMQLDIVHAHARAKLTSLSFVDEVEVFLAYEVGLRDILQLPVSAQTMLYARSAQVSQFDLRRAQLAAQKAVGDAAQVAAYLAASSPWQHHLRRLSAAAWSWRTLTPRAMPRALLLQNLHCPLTLEPYAKLSQPLVWRQGKVCVVYEAADFLRHWVAHGFEPTTRQHITLEALVRPER